jgi:hypothetical protein
MTTTPPKKGKKRAPPSTPTGRPPAKASRPSSPFEPFGELLDEPASSPSTSALPAIPPFRRTAKATRVHSGNTPLRTPTAMTVDPPRSPTPALENDPIEFTTVDETLSDEDATSAFKELLDWMRYLAQHVEQRDRLADLLGEARESLRTLRGTERDPSHTPTYAHVAATSATQQSAPRRAQNTTGSRTAKPARRQIQHAITRFERVSRELPGAPKDTLLNIVARSDLRNAPPPLPSASAPRKKPVCLVKGIKANTIATRLPEEAVTPASLPSLIHAVNKSISSADLAGCVTEILLGLRRHLTIVFDQVVEEDTRKLALQEVLVAFKTTPSAAHQLERPTHSILKFNAVPTVTPGGQEVTAAMAASCLSRHPVWKTAVPLEAPRFVFPKSNPHASHATLQVKVKDTKTASMAKKLLETSVTFVGAVRRCLPWSVAPTARQCASCLKWGHTAYTCRARTPRCDQCAGDHFTAHHRLHVSSCRDAHCTHYGIRCANCDDQHQASSVDCKFFKARNQPGRLQEFQKARVQRLRRSS